MVVNTTGWIVLGLITGLVASRIADKRGEGLSRDILLGIVGAVTSGWACAAVGATDVTGFNVWSLLVAVVGAVAFLAAWHLMVGLVGGTVVLLVIRDATRGLASRVRQRGKKKEQL